MKNLFERMFGKNKVQSSVEPVVTQIAQAPPAQELFVNDFQPEEKPPTEDGFSKLSKFLKYDHFSDGLSQGYLVHSEAGMQLYINELKSKFRMEINIQDELIRGRILSKRKKLIDLGNMLPNMSEQLQLDVASDEEMREELKYQKMMSVDGEGWIAQVLYAFEKGYRTGMFDYVNITEYVHKGIL